MNLKKLLSKKYLWFFCNGCLTIRRTRKTLDLREGLACLHCDLNSRQRSVLLATQRICRSKTMKKSNVKIIGVSDGAPIEATFKRHFGQSYRNLEFHEEPFLDITQINDSLTSSADVVICSEVLEHVQPPINLAFFGLFKILRPGGWLVLSVPHRGVGWIHIEHFPIMQNSILTYEPFPKLRGIDLEGNEREFSELVFHGGRGTTLEYRIFSESSVRKNLQIAGFTNIQPQGHKRLFGCVWEPWSRVWIAQKTFQ